jgi:hypothetical protein
MPEDLSAFFAANLPVSGDCTCGALAFHVNLSQGEVCFVTGIEINIL